MSDSSPEDFMQQALKIITELKKALEASFTEQDKHIERIDANINVLGEQVATQKNRIDTIAGNFTSLNNDFQKHTENSHASKSYVTNAIKDHAQSHDLKLQEIKSGYISVENYNAKIKEFEGRIAKLEEKIKTSTPPIAQSEEGKIESIVPKALIETSTQSEVVTGAHEQAEKTEQKSDDVHPGNNKQLQEQPGETPPSDGSGEDNTTTKDSTSSDTGNPAADGVVQSSQTQNTQHNPSNQSTSVTSATIHAKYDPNVSDLKTAILQAILKSAVYQSIESNNRGKILTKANKIKSDNPAVNEDSLHIQVILALYYLQSKPKSIPQDLYKMCYQNNTDGLKTLQIIVDKFIDNNTLIVTGATFKHAVDDNKDKNFNRIMTPHAVSGAGYTDLMTAIKARN
jgi:hypothetical protein